MPIKFRCKHCRQFLGISRSKAGDLVDCPTCGRTVRVPRLDGRAEPVPEPAMNLQDSQLVSALGELAMIGQEPAIGDVVHDEPVDEDESVAAPTPLPEPVPIDLPPPAQPVVQPAPAAPPVPVDVAAPKISAATAHSASSQPDSALAEVGELVATAATADEVVPTSRAYGLWRRADWRSLVSPPVLLPAAVLAILTFGLGFLVGRFGEPETGRSSMSVGAGRNGNQTDSPKDGFRAAPAPALKGRITYKTAEGDSRPDRGARVVVLPKEREGEAKLSITGFRASEQASDLNVAQAALRALGGDVAVVDKTGGFEISLAKAGSYHVLVISNNVSRDDDDAVSAEVTSTLAAFFEQPLKLLGRVQYHFGHVRYQGAEPVAWHYSFERSL